MSHPSMGLDHTSVILPPPPPPPHSSHLPHSHLMRTPPSSLHHSLPHPAHHHHPASSHPPSSSLSSSHHGPLHPLLHHHQEVQQQNQQETEVLSSSGVTSQKMMIQTDQSNIVQHRHPHHSSSSVSLGKEKQRWSDITSNSEDGCQESENSVRGNSESSNNSNSDLTDLDQMSESRLNGYHEQLLEALRATAAVGIHNTVGGSSIDDRDSGRETHSGRPSPKLTGEGGRKGSGERTGSAAAGGSREERESGGGGRSGHELSKKSSFSGLGVGGDPLSDYSGKTSLELDHILVSC